MTPSSAFVQYGKVTVLEQTTGPELGDETIHENIDGKS